MIGVWNLFSGALKYLVDAPAPPEGEEKLQLGKSIVSVKMLRTMQNIVGVLNERGEIHMLDSCNGMFVRKFIAQTFVNSCWDCDFEETRMLVVGETGSAILFDIEPTIKPRNELGMKFTMGGGVGGGLNKFKSSPMKGSIIGGVPLPTCSWEVISEFRAHRMPEGTSELEVVVSVLASKRYNLFFSGTSTGEVKIWTIEADFICYINQDMWP